MSQRPNVFVRLLNRGADPAFTLLRALAGFMFAFHGMQKLFGVLSQLQPPVGSQLWIGGCIELTCGTAIAIGLFARGAAFLASGTMAVAYVQFHWKLAFGSQFFPAINKGELAVVYSLLFLYVACRGAGAWSLDHVLFSRGSGAEEQPALSGQPSA